jgi:hypothetical protein
LNISCIYGIRDIRKEIPPLLGPPFILNLCFNFLNIVIREKKIIYLFIYVFIYLNYYDFYYYYYY